MCQADGIASNRNHRKNVLLTVVSTPRAGGAEPIAHVEIERAIFTEVLNLEATTTNLLLRFVECQFNEKIELSDATLIGFEMVGGAAAEIIGDRLTVKGSMRLRRERKPIPHDAHLSGLHGRKPKCEPRVSRVDQIEINKRWQQPLERIKKIHGSLVDADICLDPPRKRRVDMIEARHASQHGS